MFARFLVSELKRRWFSGKVLLLTGARQTGKTTLVKAFLADEGYLPHTRFFNCDNITDRALLQGKDLAFLIQLVGNFKVIFIDEGQKVPGIGETLKLLVDHFGKEKQLIITGSSSINLLNQTQEPLTGRKWVYQLYPLSLGEIYPNGDLLPALKALEERLVYGSYPEIVNTTGLDDKAERLTELSSSYLYKDIFEFQQVKNPDVLVRLLKALALQIGSEVAYNELASLVGIDKNTVERYVDLLEKNFVLFRLPPYFQNKRKEISKMRKVFFYDTGVRNALLNNFLPLDSRNDVGALWENFMIVERLKYRSKHKIGADAYFWKTYPGAEVDLVEARDGKLYGYEFKWSPSKTVFKAPAAWAQMPDTEFQCIHRENFPGFCF